jgi:aminopeptidase N
MKVLSAKAIDRSMLQRILGLVLVLCCVTSARAQDPFQFNPMTDSIVVNQDMSYDLRYIHMDIMVTPDTEYVAGSILFKGLGVKSPFIDRILLTLREQIIVDSVRSETGAPLEFARFGEKVLVGLPGAIQPGQAFATRVYYHGFSTTPDRHGFIHTTQHGDGTGGNIIWTSSEAYGAKNWWPVKDNPADKIDSADLWFTCDEQYTVSSNGLLTEVTPAANGTHTFKWKTRYPIAHYLIAFACSKYDTFTTYWKYNETDSLPIQNFTYPKDTEAWKKGMPVINNILDAFAEWYGPYPFVKEKYGHTQWRGGGMEHQTNTFMNWVDTGLMAHEAAHQWWGDAITCATWSDIWLNEGFATYSASRFNERLYGKERFLIEMAGKERFITSLAGGSVYVPEKSLDTVSRVFDGRTTYDKGAWVLHMLRYVLGDSTYDAVLKRIMTGPRRYTSINTGDLVNDLELLTGRDLKHFFGQWVFAEGYPQYTFSPQSAPLFGQWRSIIYIDQTPSATPIFFEMPIQVKVEGDGWDSILVLNNTQSGQTWDMMFEREPKRWIFDPFNNILDGRVEQYLKVETAQSEGVVRLQPNPVKTGESLRVSMTEGYALKGFEIYDARGAQVMQDSTMYRDSSVALAIVTLPHVAYSIRLTVINNEGNTVELLEKFIVE